MASETWQQDERRRVPRTAGDDMRRPQAGDKIAFLARDRPVHEHGVVSRHIPLPGLVALERGQALRRAHRPFLARNIRESHDQLNLLKGRDNYANYANSDSLEPFIFFPHQEQVADSPALLSARRLAQGARPWF